MQWIELGYLQICFSNFGPASTQPLLLSNPFLARRSRNTSCRPLELDSTPHMWSLSILYSSNSSTSPCWLILILYLAIVLGLRPRKTPLWEIVSVGSAKLWLARRSGRHMSKFGCSLKPAHLPHRKHITPTIPRNSFSCCKLFPWFRDDLNWHNWIDNWLDQGKKSSKLNSKQSESKVSKVLNSKF